MKITFAGLVVCMASLASAPTWSGDLVDAGCFQSEQRNVNPDYVSMPGATDLGFDIRACYPRPGKSRRFVVVLTGGESYRLDAAGNSEAAKLVDMAGKRGKKHYFVVTITGTISKDQINVDSIAGPRPELDGSKN
ncbi:MAG TPA: hypothetical protein VKB79_25920 [Bryobacteraceae bacterium]|nr:hypothetical protein [Bryobacteraceae bacterium]